jgi:hypothetical protein
VVIVMAVIVRGGSVCGINSGNGGNGYDSDSNRSSCCSGGKNRMRRSSRRMMW